MKIGVIADDFTGASDIALTLSEGGMRVAQFNGIPSKPPPKVDAGVVALKSRTEPVQQAVAQSLEACRWLREQGAEQVIFKVCSTFDSTPSGNIGPVAEALANEVGETRVAICPTFPENGRLLFQGHLFVQGRLLNESGMQNHPLTPMTDPDIRRVLKAQTTWDVTHIPYATVSKGSEEIRTVLQGPKAMVIIDAISDVDLRAIAPALKGRRLIVGASGIALGLPENFEQTSTCPIFSGQKGQGVVLSGSCSRATRAQIKCYKEQAPSLGLIVDNLMADRYNLDALCDWVMAQEAPPLIYSSADPVDVESAQKTFGGENVARKIDDFFASLAQALAQRGIERLVVAGGETSGAVTRGLGLELLEIGPRIAAGVPAVSVPDLNLALALKSGNFGAEDFFQSALDILKGTE
ncbi:HPr kinase [Amylibacter marinus]|uniref:3-oxo-tetronate kinase n=1 Tax=Amylibacter marinus TaxID=1475483 RepID=A0ABQ5VXJ9_9RHOB|nr:3-oxo-tetronate kinase [Amylibacter marinus]GLQ36024.1 HPr kinase [Amylibacter marinus]